MERRGEDGPEAKEMGSAEDLPEQRTGKLLKSTAQEHCAPIKREALTIYQALIAFTAHNNLQSFAVLERSALKTLP